jgi:hypothetical protein
MSHFKIQEIVLIYTITYAIIQIERASKDGTDLNLLVHFNKTI